MMDYGGQGPKDFAAMPRVVQPAKYRFKDPYGGSVEEYYPQNIMQDRRVQRGNTYAAMVIPAGTNPDTMVMEKKQNDTRKRTFKSTLKSESDRPQFNYPNREIATPEPVPGRVHMEIQTEKYIEQLTDKPPTEEQGVATEFYLDRPPVPLFQPKMPAKDNCKETQIYDGDHELFDFDEEVEPMLNVLCQKTLEQARMEVLEEEELRIIKHQQKEYEEIRNAELIEAQRYEAAEARIKSEVERRGVQQKARKAERKAAHQKHVARVMAKKAMGNLRHDAIRHLNDIGMMSNPLSKELEEDVLPWLIEKMNGFMQDDYSINVSASTVINEGIHKQRLSHAETLFSKKEQIKQNKLDELRKQKENVRRKQERRNARERRAKDTAKNQMYDEIKKFVINSGEVKNPVSAYEIVDIHGNFEKGKPYLGAVGGQIQQLYYIVNSIFSLYQDEMNDLYQRQQNDPTDENLKKPQTAREVLIERHFLPFFLHYLRDLKIDQISFFVYPKMQALLDALKVPNNLNTMQPDLTKLTQEQYIQFRHAFVEERLYDPTLSLNKGKKAIELILNAVCMVLCKKVPAEVSTIKIESVISKIRLVATPKGVELEDRVEVQKVSVSDENPTESEKKVQIAKNTGEKALVRILIPKKKVTQSEIAAAQEDENVTSLEVDTERLVEMDEDERALAVQRSVNALPYTVFVINQYAQKQHRQEFLNQIAKVVPDYFNDSIKQKEILDSADIHADQVEEAFIDKNCTQYDLPCLDYILHAPDYE